MNFDGTIEHVPGAWSSDSSHGLLRVGFRLPAPLPWCLGLQWLPFPGPLRDYVPRVLRSWSTGQRVVYVGGGLVGERPHSTVNLCPLQAWMDIRRRLGSSTHCNVSGQLSQGWAGSLVGASHLTLTQVLGVL